MTPLISALSKIRRSFRTWMMFFDEYLEPLWTALKRFVPEDCMCKIDAIAFHLRVHQRAEQIEPDDWKWNFSLLSLWYLRLFSLTEHNHCDWKSATTERAHTEVSKPPHEQPPPPHHPLYLLPLQLPLPEPQSSIWYRAELSSTAARVSLLRPYLSIHAQEVCVYQAFLSMAIEVITRDGQYFLCSRN